MGTRTIRAELSGTIIAVERKVGDAVRVEDVVLVLEAMKMEMSILSPISGHVARIAVAEGDTVVEGQMLAVVESADI